MSYPRPFMGLLGVLFAWFATSSPAFSADLGYAEPASLADKWQFSFSPYGWMTSVNGKVGAHGHTVDINENFFQIVDDSDSLMALMGFFEARKGRLALFTDVVWEDLGFPGHYQVQKSPFKRFPNVVANVKGKAQLDYQSLIIQSGVAYEVARWQSAPGSYTALDLMGSARYWNQEADLSLHLTGTLTADLERLGLKVKRSRRVAVARSGDLEWVDPVVGGRLRHQIAPGKELMLEGDIGGFGAGSEFSWQVVGTYGFDVNCFGKPLHTVIGYRALSVDYSENGQFGKNRLDFVQHGPVMGVTLNF
jgi:hypothetical protein